MVQREFHFFSAWMALALAVHCFDPSLAVAANRDVCSSCAYTSVYQALAAAIDGDTVRVAVGNFDEDVSISFSGSLSIKGGYSSNFATRDPLTFKSRVKSFSLNNNDTSNILISGFEIRGSSYCGVYVWSPNSNVTLEDNEVYENNYIGIFMPRFKQGIVRGNSVHHNGWRSGIEIGWSDGYEQISLSGNTVYSYTGESGAGINLGYARPGDSVVGNHLYGNRTGLNIFTTNSLATVLIRGNRIHDNLTWGVNMYSGVPIVEHNSFYKNAFGAVYYTPKNAEAAAAFQHNVVVENGLGFRVQGSSGKPAFRNNVFDNNQAHAIEIAGGNLWGPTDILPTALKYNCFSRMHGPRFSHTTLPPSYSYNSEVSGDRDDINAFDWSEGNFSISSIGFRDPAAGDFRLRSDSFLIDEGDPGQDSGSEPSPNGSRVNIGLHGGTSDAETSPALIGLSNVRAEQDGHDVVVRFDTTTDTQFYWIFVEVLKDGGFEALGASKLSGEGYVVGYRGGRTLSGTNRSIRYVGGADALRTLGLESSQVRLRIEHGNRSATASSGSFALGEPVESSIEVSFASGADGEVLETLQPQLTAEVHAEGSAIQSVTFAYKRGTGAWTSLPSTSTAPYQVQWGSTSLSAGASYSFRVRALNDDGQASEALLSNVHLCGFDLSVSQFRLTADYQTKQFQLTASNSQCAWAAESSADWLKLASASGSGSGTMSFSVQEYAQTEAARTAEITIAGRTITVRQDVKLLPDLLAKISKLTRAKNKSAQLQFSCSNAGKVSAKAASAQVYSSNSSSSRLTSKTVRKQFILKSLGAGKSQSFSLSLTAKELSGAKYLFVSCDSGTSVPEGNEKNNTLSKKL